MSSWYPICLPLCSNCCAKFIILSLFSGNRLLKISFNSSADRFWFPVLHKYWRVGQRNLPASRSQNGAWTSRLTPLPLDKPDHSNIPVSEQVWHFFSCFGQ